MRSDRDKRRIGRRFDLLIKTDIPIFSEVDIDTSNLGCKTDCVPTQRFNAYNIRLKRGRDKIPGLDKYGTPDSSFNHFWYLQNGSGVLAAYKIQTGTENSIKVLKYSRSKKNVRGVINATLVDSLGKVVVLKNLYFNIGIESMN